MVVPVRDYTWRHLSEAVFQAGQRILAVLPHAALCPR